MFAFGLKEKKKAEEIPQEENKELINHETNKTNERKKEHSETTNIKKVWNFVKKPDIYKPIFFIFFFIMTPSASSSMFYFYTNELKFHSNFMGQLKLIHSLASILGIFIYHRFLKLIPFKKMLGWSTVICACTGMTQVILVTRLFIFYYSIKSNKIEKTSYWEFQINFSQLGIVSLFRLLQK